MATVNDILIRVRQRVGDTQKTTYSDEELIGFLNDAMNFLSSELISIKDPEMVKEFTVTLGTTGVVIPSDFYSFVGAYPVFIKSDGKIYHLNKDFSGSMIVRYFAYKPNVNNVSDTIPFLNPVYHTLLNQLTSIYTLNRTAASGVVQDAQLVEQIRALIRSGKGNSGVK